MRPDTTITGAGPFADLKCSANRCASMVADVTMIFSDGRFTAKRFR